MNLLVLLCKCPVGAVALLPSVEKVSRDLYKKFQPTHKIMRLKPYFLTKVSVKTHVDIPSARMSSGPHLDTDALGKFASARTTENS